MSKYFNIKNVEKFKEKNVVITLLFLFLIFACTLITYLKIYQVTQKRCIERMSEAADSVSEDIGIRFSRDSTILNAVAEIIAAEDELDEENMQRIISEFTPITLARQINILLPGDILISKTGESVNVSGKLSFEEEVSHGEHISGRSDGITDKGRMVIRHFVPIVKNGEAIALLYSTTFLDEFPNSINISNIYNGNAEIYLVDRKNGDMLMDTLHDSLGNIWDFASYEALGEKSIEESHNEVLNGESGYTVFKSEVTGNRSYCYYAPVEQTWALDSESDYENEWTVLVEVPADVVLANLYKIRNICYIVAVIEIAIVLIYFLWILRSASVTMEKAILEERLIKAENAERAKTRFLSNMSHDIRTPMNAIIGFTTLAAANVEDPVRVRDYLSKISSSSNHLLSLINDILDMSRIESGKVNIEESECSFSEIIGDLRNILINQISSKQLEFNIDTSGVVNEDVYCDKLHLNQILLNFLSNAVKFTPAGGSVYLIIKQKNGAPEGYATYEIRVKDTGIGMSPEFVKHVFEPFERESTSTVSGIQGTGLGMSIAKNLIDMMGGNIEVKSEQGKGTEFILTIDLRLQAEKKQNDTYDDSETYANASGKLNGKRLLLVEDNELNREIAIEILSSAGLLVETACDGTEAVDIMKKAESGYFDIILMDIQMPIMNGYEATKAIRALERQGITDIPIIAMTANAFDEDKRNALESGMNDHLAKPLDIEKLFAIINKYLG